MMKTKRYVFESNITRTKFCLCYTFQFWKIIFLNINFINGKTVQNPFKPQEIFLNNICKILPHIKESMYVVSLVLSKISSVLSERTDINICWIQRGEYRVRIEISTLSTYYWIKHDKKLRWLYTDSTRLVVGSGWTKKTCWMIYFALILYSVHECLNVNIKRRCRLVNKT